MFTLLFPLPFIHSFTPFPFLFECLLMIHRIVIWRKNGKNQRMKMNFLNSGSWNLNPNFPLSGKRTSTRIISRYLFLPILYIAIIKTDMKALYDEKEEFLITHQEFRIQEKRTKLKERLNTKNTKIGHVPIF